MMKSKHIRFMAVSPTADVAIVIFQMGSVAGEKLDMPFVTRDRKKESDSTAHTKK